MGLSIQHTLTTLATSGSTQDITISGFGTPKAAMFFLVENTTLDSNTVATGARWSHGVTDGTNQYCASGNTESADPTNTGRAIHTDAVIANQVYDGTTDDLKYGFNSWITDGVRLDIDNAASSAHYVLAIFFGGTDIDTAHVGNLDLGTGTGDKSYTGMGSEPDLGFFLSNGYTAAGGTTNFIAGLSFVDFQSVGEDQRFLAFADRHGVGSINSRSGIFDDCAVGQLYSATGASPDWDGTATATATGFDITSVTADPADDWIGFLLFEFASGSKPDVAIVDGTIPTSGNYAQTDVGFEADWVMSFLITGTATMNDVTTAGGEENMTATVMVFDGSDTSLVQFCSRDGDGTPEPGNNVQNQFELYDEHGTTTYLAGTGPAIDAAGWDSTIDPNPDDGATLITSLAIKAAAGAAGPSGHPHFYARRRAA